jgi:hypothetical protein
MAWTSDDQQVHKQCVIGGKTSSSVGKSDDEKILGSQYVENGMHVGSPDAFGLMEGTVMINKSSEQQGEFALEVQDDEHIRDNLWVEQETKTKTLVADKIDVRKAFITTINKGSCNFVIDHLRIPGYKLRYTCMEGPTKDVFVRGKLKNGDTITLPEEWEWLVHQDTITVNLTPIGAPQILFVKGQQGTTIKVGSHSALPINCYYTVYGERADTPREPNVFPAEDLLTDKFVGQ